MSSLKSVPRAKLESDLVDLRQEAARTGAAVEAVRAEMTARLREPTAALQRANERIGAIGAELAARKARDAAVPTISDHAILRYIERVHGIDVESLRDGILTRQVEDAIRSGASAVKLADCTLVVKGMTVVTVTTPDVRSPRQKKPTRAQRALLEED